MKKIDEGWIAALAPNANAVSNAKKISLQGGFIKRMRSGDDSLYLGECKGSGKSAYTVSADFIDESAPVFRCSCPSRQLPCKHSIALLFEINSGREFEITEIPEDIIQKRQKLETRRKKKEAASDNEQKGDMYEVSDLADVKEKTSKKTVSKAARTKKIKKQLEGLELIRKLMNSLMQNGLGSMGSVSLKDYKSLSKQLGDYYLPGPAILFNRLILEIENFHRDSDVIHYTNAVEVLKRLRSLEKKSEEYLKEMLENDDIRKDNDILYEALGGVWKLEQLNTLGLKKENVRLIQLSFEVVFDEARREFIDRGYWMDLERGDISFTANYRPVKALKYVKQEDSCFSVLDISVLSCYPGGINKRIRWDSVKFNEPVNEDFKTVKSFAYKDFDTAMKSVKNEIKNILSENECAVCIHFDEILLLKRADSENIVLLKDYSGKYIELKDGKKGANSVLSLYMLPDRTFLHNQVIFGKVSYDKSSRRMYMVPCSIITDQGILRLEY